MSHIRQGTGLLCLVLFGGIGLSGQPTGPNTAKISQDYGGIPLYFEENRGQTDARARYVARTGNLVAFLTQDGWTLSLHGEFLSMHIAAANRKAPFTARDKIEGISNYYLGSRRITGLTHYSSVRVASILPGIDILYHGSERELEYDFVIGPGADPEALRLRFEGGNPPTISSNGDLIFKTNSGDLIQRKPRVWQEADGQRRAVECRYALAGPGEVRLVLENYNRSAALIVDPVLSYSTYLGGTGADNTTGIAVDSSGYAYVTGYTSSTDFPVTTGSFHGGMYDGFVSKLNTNGSDLIYSTFIGGSSQDQANGIALDNAGNAYVTGVTYSSDFPFTINHYVGSADAFVAKLGASGNVVFCTALGGSNADVGTAIAVDGSGSAYVAGYTYSSNFPATVGSYATTLAGTSNAFVAKLAASGQISYATYLGGAGNNFGAAIAVDSAGNAFVAGSTESSNFPVTQGAYATHLSGGTDGFITKLNAVGSALLYATYLGGSSYDYISGLAIDAAGNSYVVGNTQSMDFPTTPSAFAATKPSASFYNSGFATKLNAMGTALVYSTFLGGNNSDVSTAIAVDLNGVAFVAGPAVSSNFPTTPGALRTGPGANFCCGNPDMFLVKLSVDGSTLSYSTLLGSANGENASAVALDGNSGVYISGATTGSTYPTTSGAYQAVSPKGSGSSQSFLQTAVVSKIDFSSPALCNPSVSPQAQSLPGRGGAISFNLTLSLGCPWETLADSFITVNVPTHGVVSTSPIAISGTVSLNDSTFGGRTGTVRIGAATFTVNQDAGSCQDPAINPQSAAFDSSGGIREISLMLPSSCQWVTVPGAPWVSVPTNPSGSGSASITIFAAQNSFSPRTATVTIAGKPITITQSGSTCTAAASATPLSFAAQGGTGLVRITTSSSACPWTAYSFVQWIQLAGSGNTGQGSGSVPFVVAANPGTLSRSGQILIADQTLTITQAAGPAGRVSGYTLSTFAGGGPSSLANRGDGGPALGAYLNNPVGLAFDPATGNLFIADSGPDLIRVVTPDGNINTFAGGGSATGENVPATSALLKQATTYVAVDNTSSVYLNDFFSRIRAISQGNISTFAGTTSTGFSGDNGPATSAKLSSPSGIAADTAGNTYIADTSNGRIRRVNGGTITTFAGGGNSGLGDNGPATLATLQSPQGIAVDSTGNLYIADSANGRIRKVTQGNISTVAGGGNGGDGGPATSASLSFPIGVAVDPLGDILLIDGSFGKIRMVSLDGKISTIAGNGVLGNFNPSGLATDAAGNVYFSDSNTGTVRKLTALSAFCSYSVGTPSTLPAAGGGSSISVTTTAGCNWTAASDLSWLTLTSGSPGTGTGSVNFTVASNLGSSARTGTIVIAGQTIQVTQAGVALTIVKSHAGTFAQGQQNATYTVTVSNANQAGATSGTVTVTESAPSGLTLVSMSGTGWTCGSTTCTRSDALAGGSSYPAITVTVNVAGNATSPQVNQVSVSGGGSATANASDSAVIAGLTGSVDQADCNAIVGWAADRAKLNQSINVDIYDGATLIATVAANQSRPDVGSFLGDNGNHGFSLATPASLKDGNAHSITVKFAGTATVVSNSPRSLSCAAAQYGGSFDLADCNNLAGWAADSTRLNQSINVDIYDGATLIATVAANQSRPDVGSFLHDNGNHGFSLPTPASLKDGNPHSITVKFGGTATVVSGSPRSLSCSASAQYGGSFDLADCNNLAGWAADSNRLNQSINVDIYDGATLIATVAANQSRPDVGSFLHDNGNHGFSLPTPASLKDGNPHSITVKFAGTAIVVGNSPKSLTCSAAAQYGGSFDLANCNQIAGWAADSNRLNQSINVDDGATLIGTVAASQNRPDVGSFLGDNGNHGFNIVTPSSLKTGTAHSVGVKFGGTATSLSNSPKALTCP